MINFFDELEEKFKLSIDKNLPNFKVIYLPYGVYLEGHCGVLTLEQNEIAFKLKKGKISFFGENLIIKSLEESCVIISGKILKIERE